MKQVSVWVSAMRLRTLPLSVSGIILASSFAHYNGYFNWVVFLLALLTTLSLQILSNLANDYGDGVKGTDNEERIGPKRAIQSGLISPDAMFEAIKINILVTIILAFLLIFSSFGAQHFLLTLLFFALGILSIVAAMRYTIGGNAYGYRGLGDVFVFMFFGLVSVIGCYVLYAKTIDHVVFLPAITIGLLSAAVLNLNNMRDIDSDRSASKMTLALRLGKEKAKKYHFFLVITAIIISGLFGILYFTSIFNLIYVIVYIPLILHLKTVKENKDPKLLDPELKKVALSTFFLSVLMAIGHLL
ncbi:1,4-dihydroxy-2-naphthoate octaprenyltransferase [Hyunsoonleella sp. SJ7]|uniref:1,4-dihydroxy-2-naphthoate octaprenyltransferase n=1 Tax=Hyunsoonleella aquatilis TaxID=2762758 RepID=A0A923HEP0_9FLAO|nr:1,4-dihydroxy-2-naphthoate octaprenyltransferase [Hyunsoonleella aquatilis]MBC3758863.1 1,4-dihydroxy-2-naphthoate octaprenyltransferase [Hyunsoonleella aquatilis]